MRILLRYLRPQWRALVATFVAATFARLFLLADPQILRLIVDRYVMHLRSMPRPVFFRGVLLLIAAAVAVGMMARTLRTLQEYWITLISRRVGPAFYATSVARSLLLPYRVLEDQHSGELLHNIQRARMDAETTIGGTVRVYLGAVAIVAITAYAFTVHPLLGALHLVGVPLAGVAMLVASAPIRHRQREIARRTGALAGSATETIRNVELVKSLGIETQEIDRIEDVNRRILVLEAAKLRLERLFTMLEGVLFHGLRATILLVMLSLLYDGRITTGQFLTLFLYSSLLFAPLADAGTAVARYQEARATFDTLDVLERPAEDGGRSASGPDGIRTIRFTDVSFAYAPTHPAALRHVDLELRAGETVAFTGPSGAGKSSLVKLLLGLYRPTEGAILVDGHDLLGVNLDAYRTRFGLVTQETHLFAGTIRDNLLIARPDAADDACLAALERAAATSILARGGEGLDTRIGEGGLKLSGGERQRIAIARALLRDPDVFVFDEATSNLDSLAEASITGTIRGLSAGRRLTIIVAHRLSTIAHADRIYVLSRGTVEEVGSHAELLARNGLYAALWREQSGPPRLAASAAVV